jgi:hypothetical protein
MSLSLCWLVPGESNRRKFTAIIVRVRKVSCFSGTSGRCDWLTALPLANRNTCVLPEMIRLSLPGIDSTMSLWCYNASVFSVRVVDDGNSRKLGQLSWGFLHPSESLGNTFKYAMFVSFHIITFSSFMIIFLTHSTLCNLYSWTAPLNILKN